MEPSHAHLLKYCLELIVAVECRSCNYSQQSLKFGLFTFPAVSVTDLFILHGPKSTRGYLPSAEQVCLSY